MSVQIAIVIVCVFVALLAAIAASAANHRTTGDQVVVVIPKHHWRGEAYQNMTLNDVHDSQKLNDDDYVVMPGDARNRTGPREVRVRDVRAVRDVDDLDATIFGSESRAGPWLSDQQQKYASDDEPQPTPARHSPAAWIGWLFVILLGAAFLFIGLA